MRPARQRSVLALVAVVVVVLTSLALSRWGSGPQTGAPVAPSSAPRASGAKTLSTPVPARPTASRDPESGLPYVEVADLPRQARTTISLIDAGGPFPYAKDGVTFRNAEGLLPRHPSGWYREYTVPDPAESDRGARRIVAADSGRQLFYTGDHYVSFARVRR